MLLAESINARGLSATPTKSALVKRAANLKTQRRDYDPLYRELQSFILPRTGHFDEGRNSRRGKRLDHKINNIRATLALRTLASGMQAGITSPARPWFRLIPADYSLRRVHAVREHTNDVQQIMRQYFQSTGSYNALHGAYSHLGMFGSDAVIFDEDLRSGFVLHLLPPGRYWFGANKHGEVDTLYFEDHMTVEQIVSRFVYRNDPNAAPDWSVASRTVKHLWGRDQRSELVHVGRLIGPRYHRDTKSPLPQDKPVASVWWEVGGDGDQLLRNSGYDRNPLVASRWYREGLDPYGQSPAMDALVEIKKLQIQSRDKMEAVHRMNRPPMNAPTQLRNGSYSLLPGAVNFVDLDRGLSPAYEVNPPVQELRADEHETERVINEAMFADLFLMLAQSDRRQITAREIEERHEEKLIGLGPVLELQHREKVRPLILLAHDTLTRQGKLPDTPPELDGEQLVIDYISMLAQAMRAVETGGVERLTGYVGNIAAAQPEVLDKFHHDNAVEEYADMLGTPARILRDEREVAAIRQQRAEAEAQAAQAEQAATTAGAAHQGAQAAKVLSEAANTDSPRDVLRRIGVGI